MQLRTRSIARERAPPIDLRAAYLLHYYRPRLILFRRKTDLGSDPRGSHTIRPSFRSTLFSPFELLAVMRNVTGKKRLVSIEFTRIPPREPRIIRTSRAMAFHATIGYGSKEIPGRFLALLLLSSRHVVPPISPREQLSFASYAISFARSTSLQRDL